MKATKVDTSHFTDAQYMTAPQKRRALGDWARFFLSGMDFKRFTKRPYQHLTLHAECIAHCSCAAGHKKCACPAVRSQFAHVFPTHVGVNRRRALVRKGRLSSPRTWR